MSLTPKNIVNSQKQFWNRIDSNIINELVHLFHNGYITKYIDNERKLRGLDLSGVVIVSSVDGIKNTDDVIDLYLGIKKNNKDFVHMIVHLILTSLNPKLAGPIHIKKNVYKDHAPKLKSNTYSRIYLTIPKNKPNSLKFSMVPGYETTFYGKYDLELTKDIDVIIDVINRLFDEDNEKYYIGHEKEVTNIHKYTNNVTKRMNKSKLAARKNHGKFLITFNSSNTRNRILLRVKKTLKSTKNKVNTNIFIKRTGKLFFDK